jgi:hypothetical protein
MRAAIDYYLVSSRPRPGAERYPTGASSKGGALDAVLMIAGFLLPLQKFPSKAVENSPEIQQLRL